MEFSPVGPPLLTLDGLEVQIQDPLARRMKRTCAEHLPPYVGEAPGRGLGREAALRRDWGREDLRRRARLHADLFAGC